MKVGGRRELIVPPQLPAYGPAGAGHFLSGKTLIFIIDLVAVGSSGAAVRRPLLALRAGVFVFFPDTSEYMRVHMSYVRVYAANAA